MGEGLRFEPFDRKRHDRGGFDCGVPELNDYLKTKLGQHSRKDLTRGYVIATPEGRIAGYFTLAAGRLLVSVIPEGQGFPMKMPLPCTLVGRLAVDVEFRGRGLGGVLLVEALRIAVEMSEKVASAVVEVEAKDEGARGFYAKYGFRSLPDDRLHMYLGMGVARGVVGGRGGGYTQTKAPTSGQSTRSRRHMFGATCPPNRSRAQTSGQAPVPGPILPQVVVRLRRCEVGDGASDLAECDRRGENLDGLERYRETRPTVTEVRHEFPPRQPALCTHSSP